MLTSKGAEPSAANGLIDAALAQGSSLTSFGAGGNMLGDEAAATAAGLLPLNTTLTDVDVRSDEYSTAAATNLAAAVLASPSLRAFGGLPVRALQQDSVTSLDLAGSCLGPAEAFLLGELCLSCSSLRYLNVDGHERLCLDEMRGEPNPCEYADFSRCGLGTASAIVLSALLCTNASITSLSVAHNCLGVRAASAFSEALYFQMSLTHLDLTGNPIGAEGARLLAEALAASSSPMATVSLDGSALPVRQLRGADATRTLRLDKRGLGPYSAALIAGLVRVNSSLQTLSLAENNLGPDGCTAVLAAVLKANRVTSLDLTSNALQSEGATAVGRLLASATHSALVSVSIEGVALPVRRLTGEKTEMGEKSPDSITLAKKRLGPLSGLVIAALVAKNGVTTHLNLSGNAVGRVGAVALAEATAGNPILQQVDLRNNKLDAEAKAAVRSVAPLQVAGRLLISTPDSDIGDAEGGGGGGKSSKPGSAAKLLKAGTSKAVIGGAGGAGGGSASAFGGAMGTVTALAKGTKPRAGRAKTGL